MSPSLLDTDTMSEILKGRNPTVDRHASVYLGQCGCFSFSVISRYEILRGLKLVTATTQQARFQQICGASNVLHLTDAVLDRATDLWVAAMQGGYPAGDADLFIAATALEHGLQLVTGNTQHFTWIGGLNVADWRDP